MATDRLKLWPALGMFLLLTAGAGIVWGFAGGFLLSLWESNFARREFVYENVTVTTDGEVLLSGYGPSGALPARRTSGEKVDRNDFLEMAPTSLPERDPDRREITPDTWASRLSWLPDGRGVTWFLIEDDVDGERGYFAGFDARSKLPIGFMGKRGFSVNRPSAKDHFLMKESRVATKGLENSQYQGASWQFESEVAHQGDVIPRWLVYFHEDDEIFVADLRERTVKSFAKGLGAINSIGIVRHPIGPPKAERKDRRDEVWAELLGVRLLDRVVTLDAKGERRGEFVLPEKLADRGRLELYFPRGDQLIATTSVRKEAGESTTQATWIDPAGAIVKEEAIDLQGYQGPNDRMMISILAGVIPIPIMWLGTALGPMALSKMEMHGAANYGEAVQMSLFDMWPAGIILGLVCLAAAWQVAKWQRQANRRHTALWCTLVFITGLAGLIGYRLLHGRPNLAACRMCGRVVPQRRASCAACGKEFAPPATTGVEVFA